MVNVNPTISLIYHVDHIALPKVLQRLMYQCKLFCLHNTGCQAVNYNFTSSVCTYLTQTCPIALHHPDMTFALFTARRSEQCAEWIPNANERGHPVSRRVLTVDNKRFIARIQKSGNDYIGYIYWNIHHCFAGTV